MGTMYFIGSKYFAPDANSQLIGKNLMLVNTEGRRRRVGQRMRCFNGITWAFSRIDHILGHKERAWKK